MGQMGDMQCPFYECDVNPVFKMLKKSNLNHHDVIKTFLKASFILRFLPSVVQTLSDFILLYLLFMDSLFLSFENSFPSTCSSQYAVSFPQHMKLSF